MYAATAVRYIGGEGFPPERLEDILKLHEGLDYLYTQVIDEAMKWDNFDIVMGSLVYLRYQLNINDLSRILLAFNKHLTSPGIRFALRRCHSILVIPDNNTQIEPCHASLRDFLTNQSRSGTLFHAPATCHGQLMFGCLSAITRAFSDGTRPPKYGLISWYYHAHLFLSTGEGLDEQKDETQELVKKIDLNWVKLWMIEAFCWAGLRYLKGDFPLAKVQKWSMILDIHHWWHWQKDRPDKHWTSQLGKKLRSIHVILEVLLWFTLKDTCWTLNIDDGSPRM